MDCRDDEDRVLGNEHRCTPMHTDGFWLCVYVVCILHFAPETFTKEIMGNMCVCLQYNASVLVIGFPITCFTLIFKC